MDFPALQVQAEQVAVSRSVLSLTRLGTGLASLGSELQRLEHGPAGQIGAGKAEREAESSFSIRELGRGLPAGADGASSSHGVQALGRPRRRRPARPAGAPRRRS